MVSYKKMDNVKHKILIIDDDEFLLDMYAVKFKEKGFEVDVACGGKEALDKIKEGISPEVVLLDVVMPGMDGFELLETIRKRKPHSGQQNYNLCPISAKKNTWTKERIWERRII